MVMVGMLSISLASSAAVSFDILRQQDQCEDADKTVFGTGGQYVDVTNGVKDNRWSMLVRWQYPVPWRLSSIICDGGEIHINTWIVDHNPILGGGYNDMAGYSWDLASAPRAFVQPFTNHPADLVVQAYLSQTKTLIHLAPNRDSHIPSPAFQVSLFAYLVDLTHPTLHPIAVIGLISDDRPLDPSFCGASGLNDYPQGVWFSAFLLSCVSPFNTLDPFGDVTESIPAPYWAPQIPLQFVRMRVSPENWKNTISIINNSNCSNCPAKGYSTNPQDYVVKYAGIIAEASLLDSQDGSLGDLTKDQISVALNWRAIGIYRRVEN